MLEDLPDGTQRGIDTQVYTTPEIERVACVAFDLDAGDPGGNQRLGHGLRLRRREAPEDGDDIPHQAVPFL